MRYKKNESLKVFVIQSGVLLFFRELQFETCPKGQLPEFFGRLDMQMSCIIAFFAGRE